MENREDIIGHRERVLDAFEKRGGSSLADYQLLEILLFFVIKRKDVKPLAKALLAEFGTIENVLCAPQQKLLKIDGVGRKTTLFFKIVYAVFLRITEGRLEERVKVESLDDAADYFKEMFRFAHETEHLAIMMLDNSNRIIHCSFVSEGAVDQASINLKELVQPVLDYKAAAVIIAHNHPQGDAHPSLQDIDFTLKIREVLLTLGVSIEDHIILNEKTAFSMRSDLNYANYFERINKTPYF